MTLSRSADIPDGFDPLYYLIKYPDISSNVADPSRHYREIGKTEGRYGSELLRTINDPVKNGRKVLFADKRLLEYDRTAGERASLYIIETFLKLGYEVAYLPLECGTYEQKYLDAFLKLGVEVPIPPADKAANWSPVPWLEKNAALFDLFYLVRLEVAECMLSIIRAKAPHAPVLYHAPDLGWIREEREALITNNKKLADAANIFKKRELAVMASAKASVVVSDEEKRLLLDAAPVKDVIAFPVLYSEVAKDVPPYWDRRDFVFIGGGRHRPNTDASLWFAGEIWPYILEKLPRAYFHIVGAYQQQEVEALNGKNNIIVEGFVEDLDSFMAKMRVSVAPLRFGAGIKGKVGMSLGLGLPCICTEMAAEGMWLKNGAGVMLAENARDFADVCVEVYSNSKLWNDMSLAGRKHIEKHFGIEANDAQFSRALYDLDLLPDISWFSKAPFPSFSRLAPLTDKPRCSIIISASKSHISDLKGCLSSIALYGAPDYEILLVHAENQPPNEILGQFPEVRVISSGGGSWQQQIAGALNARGRELIFLSPETRILPGCMEKLRQASVDSSRALLINRAGNNAAKTASSDSSAPTDSIPLAFVPAAIWNKIFGKLFDPESCGLPTCLAHSGIEPLYLDSARIIALREYANAPRREPWHGLSMPGRRQFRQGETMRLAYVIPPATSFWQQVAESRQALFKPAGMEVDLVSLPDLPSAAPGAWHGLILPEPLPDGQPAAKPGGFLVAHDLAVLEGASLPADNRQADALLAGTLAHQMELRKGSSHPDRIICLPAFPDKSMPMRKNQQIYKVGIAARAPDALRWACGLIYGLRLLAPSDHLPFEISIITEENALGACVSRFEKRMLSQALVFQPATTLEAENILREQSIIAAPFADHVGAFAARLLGIPATFPEWCARTEDSWRKVAADLHALRENHANRPATDLRRHQPVELTTARLGAEQLHELLERQLLGYAEINNAL